MYGCMYGMDVMCVMYVMYVMYVMLCYSFPFDVT